MLFIPILYNINLFLQFILKIINSLVQMWINRHLLRDTLRHLVDSRTSYSPLLGNFMLRIIWINDVLRNSNYKTRFAHITLFEPFFFQI